MKKNHWKSKDKKENNMGCVHERESRAVWLKHVILKREKWRNKAENTKSWGVLKLRSD